MSKNFLCTKQVTYNNSYHRAGVLAIIRIVESLCEVRFMLIVVLHHGNKWFKIAIGFIVRRFFVHDCVEGYIFGLVLEAGRKVEEHHGYTTTRSFLASLLVVKWIEKID